MGSKLGPVSAVLVLSFLFLGPGTADPARAAKELLLPDWAAVFNADGSLKDEVDEAGAPGANGVPDYVDLYHGLDAVFVPDNLSDGVATDMSALLLGDGLVGDLTVEGAEDGSEPVMTGVADEVYNGVVGAAHDIGNTYLLVEKGPDGELLLLAGVERIAAFADTYVEIEFNQDLVRLSYGAPWPIHGSHTADDLRIRLIFTAGLLDAVDFERWTLDAATGEGGFQRVKHAKGTADGSCAGTGANFTICLGAPPIAGGEVELWDDEFTPVEYVAPDSFVEVGVNVTRMLGVSPDFTAIQIRTPKDIAMSTFRNLGYWAEASAQ
jgi:hypothetical protein